MPVTHITWFTDPACPRSWAAEPALRRLRREFGAGVRFTFVMSGLAREFGAAGRVAEEWLDVAAATGMPVDARLWLRDPPRSSHPACLAVKAAAEQGDPGRYLRRLREGMLCGLRRLDGAGALTAEAVAAGLGAERFRRDLASTATIEAFAADLDLTARAAERAGEAAAGGHLPLPSLEALDPSGTVHGAYGAVSHEALREAVAAAGAAPHPVPAPPVVQALRAEGPLATPEVAALCDLPGPRAAAELWRLATEWRVRPERRGTGELWHAA